MAALLFDLSGRVALVTGGTRGVGLAVADALHSAGARVVIAARAAPTQTPHSFIRVNLIEQQERAGLIPKVLDGHGRLDILVHAAGQQYRAAAENFPIDDWRDIMELHLTAAMQLSQEAAKHMLNTGKGKIIHIASVLSFQGGLMVPAYASAKHAVAGLIKALAVEWAARGINVNAIAPGYMALGVGQPVLDDPVRGPQILSRIPAGRAGNPDDLAGAAIFLASDASNYVHGHTLVVDGGWLAR